MSAPVALHHSLAGPRDAPVLVLGHSIGCDESMWDPQAEALSARFSLLRYDHRGHGESPVPPGPYSIDDLGADVLALLDRLELARVHLGGLSLGGMVAMWIAARAPERVERLVLCCTSACLGPRDTWLDRARRVRGEGMQAITPASLERWLTPAFRAREPATVAHLERTLLATAPEGYAACCEAIAGMDLRAELAGIAAPTLVVAGEHDPSTPPAHGRGHRRGDPRRPARGARPTPPTWPTSSSPKRVTAAVIEHLGAPDPKEPMTTLTSGAWRCAARCSATPMSTARSARTTDFTARVPGLHHPLRLGRDLDPPGPGPPHPQLHHADRAGRRAATSRSSRCTCAPRCATG